MNQYEKVENIINEWDPIGLIPPFPPDEYKNEIKKIVELLQESKDNYEIAKGIKQIFENAFGEDVFNKSEDECFLIARRVMEEQN